MIEHQFCMHPRSRQLIDWMLTTSLPGPLLITGVSSVGKHTLALIIARRFLCEHVGAMECDCPSCVALRHSTHSDLLCIGDGDAPLTVDAVRHVRSQMSQTPMNSRGRVVVVLGCERLNIEASNALLTCIEEPVGNTQWILTASHTKQIPATLLSRLYRLRLPRVPDTTIVQWATRVLQSTHPPLDIVTQSAGRPGILHNTLTNSQQYQQFRDDQEMIKLGLWGDTGDPQLMIDTPEGVETLLIETGEQLRQSAFQGSIPWNAWLHRAQILNDAIHGLKRHQPIVQLLHYAHSQQ